MKALLMTLSFALSPLTFADQSSTPKRYIYLENCNNFGTGVNFDFQRCVNSNNSILSRQIGGFYSYCQNMGVEVDYFYTSCVNDGFREAQIQLQNRVFLSDCQNYNRQTLDFFFVQCVNNNYRVIMRVLSVE
jgi:hypothetical protein